MILVNEDQLRAIRETFGSPLDATEEIRPKIRVADHHKLPSRLGSAYRGEYDTNYVSWDSRMQGAAGQLCPVGDIGVSNVKDGKARIFFRLGIQDRDGYWLYYNFHPEWIDDERLNVILNPNEPKSISFGSAVAFSLMGLTAKAFLSRITKPSKVISQKETALNKFQPSQQAKHQRRKNERAVAH